MIRKLEMAFKDKFSFLNRFQPESFITPFALFTYLLVCMLAFVFHNVYLCEASIDQAYKINDLPEDKSCKAGQGTLALGVPSEISCLFHCSGQLQIIGIVYNLDSGACQCCSDITEPDGSVTEGRTTFYTINGNTDKPRQCGDLVPKELFNSGVHTVFPNGQNGTEVFCDFDDPDGPWTVIQRRVDGTVDFYRPYKSYQDGFGNLSGNFWLGLDTMSTLTLHSGKTYALKVILVDRVNGEKFAKYSDFAVMTSSTGYSLFVRGYSGTAGDSLSYHYGLAFTTFDNDSDTMESENCAITNRGAWWYGRCLRSCLNGEYGDDTFSKGITWQSITGVYRSATFATMKLKENN